MLFLWWSKRNENHEYSMKNQRFHQMSHKRWRQIVYDDDIWYLILQRKKMNSGNILVMVTFEFFFKGIMLENIRI